MTHSVAAPGDTHPSDATGKREGRGGKERKGRKRQEKTPPPPIEISVYGLVGQTNSSLLFKHCKSAFVDRSC